jgi:hypothetical protein
MTFPRCKAKIHASFLWKSEISYKKRLLYSLLLFTKKQMQKEIERLNSDSAQVFMQTERE